MSGRADWGALRARRMAEPGAQDGYEAARLAFELGRSVRQLREQQGWSQASVDQVLAQPAGHFYVADRVRVVERAADVDLAPFPN